MENNKESKFNYAPSYNSRHKCEHATITMDLNHYPPKPYFHQNLRNQLIENTFNRSTFAGNKEHDGETIKGSSKY